MIECFVDYKIKLHTDLIIYNLSCECLRALYLVYNNIFYMLCIFVMTRVGEMSRTQDGLI